MSIKEITEKYRRAIEERNKGNLKEYNEFLNVIAPDAVFHRFPWPDAKGVETWKQGAAGLTQGFSDVESEFEDIIGEGNAIAWRYTMRMKHTGESQMFPGPPTGKDLVLKGAWFFKVKNDKIVEVFNYTDLLGAYQQLGIMPPMGQQ